MKQKVNFLSDSEIRQATRRLRKLLARNFPDIPTPFVEEALRFGPVAAEIRAARKNRGIDLKTASKAIGIPQYRLRYIESSNLKYVRAADLRAYIEFLELTKWFHQWNKANPKLAARYAAK